ncbi:hypothetical protein [Amycolatopsis rubida]|uniref:Uncharacterized protein n=1 Tax=Amycolatopsis rubida TaxID=112413 RepID=A0A1I5XAS7_9PSEU|nr:hypothetical protein [Amycolatopsis rubida]SFQ29068.1 hypothetical protein SAMN05421854_110129 [Amycolatopsis rubida]
MTDDTSPAQDPGTDPVPSAEPWPPAVKQLGDTRSRPRRRSGRSGETRATRAALALTAAAATGALAAGCDPAPVRDGLCHGLPALRCLHKLLRSHGIRTAVPNPGGVRAQRIPPPETDNELLAALEPGAADTAAGDTSTHDGHGVSRPADRTLSTGASPTTSRATALTPRATPSIANLVRAHHLRTQLGNKHGTPAHHESVRMPGGPA